MRKRLDLPSAKSGGRFFNDDEIGLIKKVFDLRIHVQGSKIILQGHENGIEQCEKSIAILVSAVERGEVMTQKSISSACEYFSKPTETPEDGGKASLAIRLPQMNVEGKTEGQKDYLNTLSKSVITFVSGPAGTGKTYLAVAYALAQLVAGVLDKIILVRPAVEAGEKLGFLPGDLKEKIRPYMNPVYDALSDFLGPVRLESYSSRGLIEIVPLAYMRGRTMNRCYMILDEAQNTTPEQMKMFLTRMGKDTRAVVAGDLTQTDLGGSKSSGLHHAEAHLQKIKMVSFVRLEPDDIVRSPVVEAIVRAYDEAEKS